MKVTSKVFLTIGVLAIILGCGVLFVDFPEFTRWQDTFSYILFESAARVFWILGIISLIIGNLLFKRVKKRNRIFY
ncbi:hypothetical protein [Piscibacillus halophilus]|uniref:Uncharacterized protein n=1 Tax=Piscibacillus halophilus TaxID=571933 RepID=A0A1H9DNS5_9BACI|nr:hypothetical protein [Piscibacillus halophilus]SEQ15051.1 hypothetical protein SAMN05216362_10769 [Piscibacillus halophilus]